MAALAVLPLTCAVTDARPTARRKPAVSWPLFATRPPLEHAGPVARLAAAEDFHAIDRSLARKAGASRVRRGSRLDIRHCGMGGELSEGTTIAIRGTFSARGAGA